MIKDWEFDKAYIKVLLNKIDIVDVDRNKIDELYNEINYDLLGSKFDPVWVGNRIKKNFLYKDKKSSFWQTPTITPVAMSALAAA